MVSADIAESEIVELERGGIRGVRFNFVSHLGRDADLDAVRSVVEKIGPFGWHAVFHFDADRLETLAPVLRSLPVTMVIDHMGRVDAGRGLVHPAFKVLLIRPEDVRFWSKVFCFVRLARHVPHYTAALT